MILIFSIFACTEPTEKISLPELPELPQRVEEQEQKRGIETTTREAVIALVGEVRGEIEPCGCPTLPYGGFSRRSQFMQTLPDHIPTFHLDAGELLLKGFSGIDRDTSKTRAQLMLELSHDVGLDVLAVGPTDISTLGIKKLQAYNKFPIISASYQDQNGTPLFPPVAVIEKKGFRLGVIGVGTLINDPTYRESIRYVPPQKAIADSLALLPRDLDLIVTLGSIDDEEAHLLAQEDLGVAAMLTTRGSALEDPYNNDQSKTLIIETPERGRYVQTIYLHLNTLPQSKLHISALEQPWRDQIMGQENPSSKQKIIEEGRGVNLAYIELNPLNESYDPPSKTNTDVMLDQFKKDRLEEAAQTAIKPATDEEVGYASSGACSTCHSKEFAKWVFTDHANAWQSLIARNSQDNPECIQCHTTGFGEVGGLGELTDSNIRRLKSVQCESCHGPLKGHPDAQHVQAKPITPKTCLPCHDEANSPEFDFGTYLSKSTCQMD